MDTPQRGGGGRRKALWFLLIAFFCVPVLLLGLFILASMLHEESRDHGRPAEAKYDPCEADVALAGTESDNAKRDWERAETAGQVERAKQRLAHAKDLRIRAGWCILTLTPSPSPDAMEPQPSPPSDAAVEKAYREATGKDMKKD
jgi:hypothetical protein